MILGTTGHRTLAIPGYEKYLDQFAIVCLERIAPDRVITGMALGWDTAVATACCWLGIPYVAAVPFIGQPEEWSAGDQEVWRHFLKAAAEVVVIAKGYHKGVYHERNRWIVDHSDAVMALWDGRESGGTYHCYKYALDRVTRTFNVYNSFKSGIERREHDRLKP